MRWLTRWLAHTPHPTQTSASQAKARLAHLLDAPPPCSSTEHLLTTLQKELMQVVHRHVARERLVAKVAFEELLGDQALRIKVVLAARPAAREPIRKVQPARKRSTRRRRRKR